LIVSILAVGSWFAMRTSMLHSVDRDLLYRIGQVMPYVQGHSLTSRQQFDNTFADASSSPVIGVFVQFTDEDSRVIFESQVLRAHNVASQGTGPVDGKVVVRSGGERRWPIRVASQRIIVNGVPLTVHLIEPLRDMFTSLREYTLYLGVLVLVILCSATFLGYFLSKRALVPVEQIRLEAESIDPADLTARLHVPGRDDELSRLAKTLNAMLGRIEAGFQTIQQFTADASHELRAPLSLILTASEISLRRERPREELESTLRKVASEARHMARLVDQLLDLARAEAKVDGIGSEEIDLAKTAREICENFEPLAGAKEIALTYDLASESLVEGDPTELRRLVTILLDNALRYTLAGRISVRVHNEHEGVLLAVQDTGIGIETELIPKIFDRFWRADKARSRGESGAGLGLSLASQIVRRHHGTIWVDSAEDQGATFFVRFPRIR
jgi:heavy metal sensor kinase